MKKILRLLPRVLMGPAFISTILYFALPFSIKAQRLIEATLEQGKPEDREEPSTTWQLGLDVGSLVGLSVDRNFHFGVQAKRIPGQWGMRLSGELFPASSNFSESRIVDIDSNLVQNEFMNLSGVMGRVGLGIERSHISRWGRFYYGADFLVSYEEVNNYTHRVWSDPMANLIDDTLWTNPTNMSAWNTRGLGAGIAPLIGYDFHAGKRFGFSLESRLDFAVMWHKSDQNPNVPGWYLVRSFPLFEARIHYRL